ALCRGRGGHGPGRGGYRQPDHQLPAQESRGRGGGRGAAAENRTPGRRRSDAAWRTRDGPGGPYCQHLVGAGAMNGPLPPRVGIIGLGSAGSAAARNLLAAAPRELALTVFDKVPAQCEPFRGAATLAASADEALRESDVVVLALPG